METQTKKRAFLVFDETANFDEEQDRYVSNFANWLEEEGFTKLKRIEKSWFRSPSFYVDINEKTYAPRMPGVAIYEAIGGRIVTADDFKTIYEIYKKYDGKGAFEV